MLLHCSNYSITATKGTQITRSTHVTHATCQRIINFVDVTFLFRLIGEKPNDASIYCNRNSHNFVAIQGTNSFLKC